jgi:mannose-6-phosphate isomerase-like protein (cupin superfamily)
MVERLDRRFSSIPINEHCRIRFVESNGGLVIPDTSMHKTELPDKFDGINIEFFTLLKLNELGFMPQNDTERRMLEFLDNPLVHKYPLGDSPARYFMEVIVGNHAILASYLPPHSETSKHPHSREYGILEDYYLMGGKSDLRLGNEAIELNDGTCVEVPLDTHHQLMTGEKPAFTLIVMKNAGLVDRKYWHK